MIKIHNGNPIYWVPCMSDDLEVMARRYHAARRLFDKLCPPGARIINLKGRGGRGRSKSIWEVKYVREPGHEHIHDEELAFQIHVSKPNNTDIKSKNICFSPSSLPVVYSVLCACYAFREADEFENKSVKEEFDYVDEIKVEL